MRPGAAELTPAGAGGQEMLEFAKEFWAFMRERKKYWLMPVLVMTVLLAGLIVLTKGSAVAPFLYALF